MLLYFHDCCTRPRALLKCQDGLEENDFTDGETMGLYESELKKMAAEVPNLGRIGYEAYAVFTGGKTYDNRAMPKWDDLRKDIQEAWRAAALAIQGHK